MEYLVGIIVIAIFLFCLLRKNELYSPLTIFMFIWTVIITLYNLKIIELNRINEYSWTIIFVGIISFVIGYFFIEFILSNKKTTNNNTFSSEYINYNFLIILAIITIILLLPLFLQQFSSFITTFDLNLNKTNLVLEEVSGVGVIYQYFARPLQLIVPMIATVMIFKKHKKAKIFFVLCIVILIEEFISGGIKQSFVFWVIYIFLVSKMLGITINNRKYKIDKKLIILCVTLISVIFYFMSTYSNLLESLYLYIVGCIPMFETAITADYFIMDGYTYGFSAFQGIFRVGYKIINTLGFFPNDTLLLLGDNYRFLLETGRDIGGSHMYNSMATVFYSFFYDGGIIAVVVGMFLFGAVASKIYSNVKNNNSSYNLIMYIFLMYFILNVEARFQFYSVVQAMGFFLIIFLVKPLLNKKIKIITK